MRMVVMPCPSPRPRQDAQVMVGNLTCGLPAMDERQRRDLSAIAGLPDEPHCTGLKRSRAAGGSDE